MKRGRKPKPKASVVLPMVQSWAPPDHLSRAAAAEFVRVTELLRQKGVLEFCDGKLVEQRAVLVEQCEQAYAAVEKDGAFLTSDRGNLAPHPGLKVVRDAAALLRLIDQSLGLLPPRDRAKPDVKPATSLDKWTAKLRGGNL
jgi:P27 family predicted phage terminase small subunit